MLELMVKGAIRFDMLVIVPSGVLSIAQAYPLPSLVRSVEFASRLTWERIPLAFQFAS